MLEVSIPGGAQNHFSPQPETIARWMRADLGAERPVLDANVWMTPADFMQ